jgi:uncharacterized protein (DUF58 family)
VKPIFRILYRLYRIYSWARYLLPRKVTRAGLGLLGALGLSLLLLPDTENNVAYQTFPLLLFFLGLAWTTSFFFRAQFAAERLAPRIGTAGSPLSYRVVVKNPGRRTQAGLTLLENLADSRPSFNDWLTVQLADENALRSFRFSHRRRTDPFKLATLKEAPLPPIPPGQAAEARVQVLPLRRGVLRFHGVTVARPDPFGLVRSFINVSLPQTMLILPKRYPLPPIALPGSMKYQQGGVALASSVGQSEEFVSLRDYREGDPLRHIHWRSWARTGKPVVKEFEDEFFVRHALVLDTFTDQPHSEVFEEAVSIAASFACTVRTEESLLDLLFVGPESYCFTAGRSLGGSDQMLQILASVRACANQPFGSLEHLVLSQVRLLSGCVCVLMAWDKPRREFVEKLQALDIPVLVLVVAGAGQAAQVDPGPMANDPAHFHVLETGQVEQGLARLS